PGARRALSAERILGAQRVLLAQRRLSAGRPCLVVVLRGPVAPEISFVIPFLIEEATLRPLFEQIAAVMVELGRSYEVIFVDDGSIDAPMTVVDARAGEHPQAVGLVQMR